MTTGRLAALLLGVLAIAAALAVLVVPTSASGADCGSVLAPKDVSKWVYLLTGEDCTTNRGTRARQSAVLGLIGATTITIVVRQPGKD